MSAWRRHPRTRGVCTDAREGVEVRRRVRHDWTPGRQGGAARLTGRGEPRRRPGAARRSTSLSRAPFPLRPGTGLGLSRPSDIRRQRDYRLVHWKLAATDVIYGRICTVGSLAGIESRSRGSSTNRIATSPDCVGFWWGAPPRTRHERNGGPEDRAAPRCVCEC
jgi:hypothetical protein